MTRPAAIFALAISAGQCCRADRIMFIVEIPLTLPPQQTRQCGARFLFEAENRLNLFRGNRNYETDAAGVARLAHRRTHFLDAPLTQLYGLWLH